ELDRAHFIAEAVPDLQEPQRHRRRIRAMAESVDGQPPERRPVLGQHVKADGSALQGGDREGTDLHKLAVMRLPVVEKFFAEQAVEPRDVGVERRQLDVITSGKSWQEKRNGKNGDDDNTCSASFKHNLLPWLKF